MATGHAYAMPRQQAFIPEEGNGARRRAAHCPSRRDIACRRPQAQSMPGRARGSL